MSIAVTRTFFVSVTGFITAIVSIATVFIIGEVTHYSAWMSYIAVPLLLLFFIGTITSFVTAVYLLQIGMKASAWMKGILVLVLILDALMAVLYIEFQRGILFEKIPEDILKQVLIARAPYLHSWSADVQQFTRHEI